MEQSELAGPTTATWCGLAWTPWRPLDRQDVRTTAPQLGGVYRIRREGDPRRLVYIGQTGRGLRERLLALTRHTNAQRCPFNDPHTAAPHLWLMVHLDEVELEFSCAPVVGDVSMLRGTEDMLLWRHRVESSCSTEANYGRFYPGWSRPTNRSIKRGGVNAPGRQAARLVRQMDAFYFGLNEPALQGDGPILAAPWWDRAALSRTEQYPDAAGIYCIFDGAASEQVPLYVGEAARLEARLQSHLRSRWPSADPWVAYRAAPDAPKYILHELESDVLGWHFSLAGSAPSCQYRAEAGRPD